MKKSCLVIAILSVLAFASPAPASYDPLGSGTTKLVLEKSFAHFLTANGIELSALNGAKREGDTFTLSIASGRIDPSTGKGEIESEGTLVFERGRKRVLLRNLVVKAKPTPLIAKVGGSQLKVAKAGKIDSKRMGFGTRFTAKQLRLTPKAVTRLNKKLRPEVPFVANQLLGSLVSTPRPRTVTIEDTGTATITLDPAFVQKLDSAFVSLNPIAPAQRFGGTLTFPIAAGGAIAPDGSEGTLRTAGALEFLRLGSGQVFWQEPWLDLGARSETAEVDIQPTPTFPGKIGRVGVLDYAPVTVASDPKARTITVGGAPLALSAEGAARFNEAFAQGKGQVFAAGEVVGSVAFEATGR